MHKLWLGALISLGIMALAGWVSSVETRFDSLTSYQMTTVGELGAIKAQLDGMEGQLGRIEARVSGN